MMENQKKESPEKVGVLKALFPAPTIVVMVFFAVILTAMRNTDTNEPLSLTEYFVILAGVYAFVCGPIDIAVWIIRNRRNKNEKNLDFARQLILQHSSSGELEKQLESQGNQMAEMQKQMTAMQAEIQKVKDVPAAPESIEVSATLITPEKPREKSKIFVDFYFYQAAKLAIDKNKLTTGMVMREFKVGHIRADRIIKQLVAHQMIIADPKKNDFYTPLLTRRGLDDFEANYRMIASDDYDTVISQSRIDLYNNQYDYMEGHDFETYCAELLQKIGFDSVEVTPGSNDQGIDIIAYQHGIKFGIQCKRYSSDVGNKAVQEAFAGSTYYHCNVAAVLTNQHFTAQAKDLAKRTGVLLWDRDYLDAMITECKGNELSTE